MLIAELREQVHGQRGRQLPLAGEVANYRHEVQGLRAKVDAASGFASQSEAVRLAELMRSAGFAVREFDWLVVAWNWCFFFASAPPYVLTPPIY